MMPHNWAGCNFIIQEALISNVTIQLRASSCHMFSYGAVHVIALCSILFKKKVTERGFSWGDAMEL